MKITKFLNIDIEPAPLEMKLDVEMRCREIMASNEINDIKKYCTHLCLLYTSPSPRDQRGSRMPA